MRLGPDEPDSSYMRTRYASELLRHEHAPLNAKPAISPGNAAPLPIATEDGKQASERVHDVDVNIGGAVHRIVERRRINLRILPIATD